MKNLLIGSRALNHWDYTLKIKDTTDYDVISDKHIEGTEHHKPEDLDNYGMEMFASDEFITLNGHKLYIVNMEGLAIIKRSHLWRHIGFEKHITQFHRHGLSDQCHKFTTSEITALKTRLHLTKEMFPINTPTLSKTKDEFFGDGIYRRYDHDLLHELIAYYKKPLYTYIKYSGSEVLCSYDKWCTLSDKDKVKCVAEEVYVTALERFILVDNHLPYKLSYIKALNKTCTTMTSGWFRDYAIDNYPEILGLFSEDRIKNTIKMLGDI